MLTKMLVFIRDLSYFICFKVVNYIFLIIKYKHFSKSITQPTICYDVASPGSLKATWDCIIVSSVLADLLGTAKRRAAIQPNNPNFTISKTYKFVFRPKNLCQNARRGFHPPQRRDSHLRYLDRGRAYSQVVKE